MKLPSNHLQFRGLVAIILALSVGVSMALVSFGTPHLNEPETNIVSTGIGAIIGALATYLGFPDRDTGGTDGPSTPS